MNKKNDNVELWLGDCREKLLSIADNSIDFVLTDPPYFINGMGNDWDNKSLLKSAKKAGVIKSLPTGMRFDRKQGLELQKFMFEIAEILFNKLKPGAFLVCFSQARLYHRMAIAFDDVGFEIRDMFAWHYTGQAKAFSQDHFVHKRKDLTVEQKNEIIEEMSGRKTPQLKPQLEPMVFAQKPKEGTFVDNWMKWGVGLVDTTQSLDGKFPGNLMIAPKPNKAEKGSYNNHLTVKPVTLLSHLVKLFTTEGQVVLDPFMGSGSSGIAALKMNRKFIGIEIDTGNFEISSKRIGEILDYD